VIKRYKQDFYRLLKRYLQGYRNIHGYPLDNGLDMDWIMKYMDPKWMDAYWMDIHPLATLVRGSVCIV
jgi:hypothetical protein